VAEIYRRIFKIKKRIMSCVCEFCSWFMQVDEKSAQNLPVTNILDLAITYLSFTLALEGITQVRNFLYHYLNISPYPFQTTSFKTNKFCIPEVFYVSGAKR
jgi:hypothetical protein